MDYIKKILCCFQTAMAAKTLTKAAAKDSKTGKFLACIPLNRAVHLIGIFDCIYFLFGIIFLICNFKGYTWAPNLPLYIAAIAFIFQCIGYL